MLIWCVVTHNDRTGSLIRESEGVQSMCVCARASVRTLLEFSLVSNPMLIESTSVYVVLVMQHTSIPRVSKFSSL